MQSEMQYDTSNMKNAIDLERRSGITRVAMQEQSTNSLRRLETMSGEDPDLSTDTCAEVTRDTPRSSVSKASRNA